MDLFSCIQIPKGALLHAHLDATVNVEVLLRLALRHPAIHIRTSENLIASNTIGSITPEFRALPQSEWGSGSSITASSYVPGEWVSLQNARRNFDEKLGGPEGFDKWVTSAITISPAEAYRTHNTTEKVRAFVTHLQKLSSYYCIRRFGRSSRVHSVPQA